MQALHRFSRVRAPSSFSGPCTVSTAASAASGPLSAASRDEIETAAAAADAQARGLRARGAEWVAAAGKLGPPTQGQTLKMSSCTEPRSHEGSAQWSLHQVQQLDTRLLDTRQVSRMQEEGVTLLEPFGGLAAGAEMLLRNGVPIQRYMYVDISPSTRKIARHRLQLLSARYGPRLFPATAWDRAFDALPQDIYRISRAALEEAGALDGTQWMVVAGWECQDLSPAGSGKGLQGERSRSFFPLVEMLGQLQQLQAARPPVFLLENTAMKFPFHNHGLQVQRDFRFICGVVGPPVELDAARVGSFAHRLRDYWTNLACTQQMQAVLDLVERDSSLQLEQILGPGRRPQHCSHERGHPWYPVNRLGYPEKVLPTLVSKFASGWVWGADDAGVEGVRLCPLTIEEREQAVGYRAGDTAAPGVTPRHRHAVTGACMDASAMQSLLAVALALRLGPAAEGCGQAQAAAAAAEPASAELPAIIPVVKSAGRQYAPLPSRRRRLAAPVKSVGA